MLVVVVVAGWEVVVGARVAASVVEANQEEEALAVAVGVE
jgi:hypothetical protein